MHTLGAINMKFGIRYKYTDERATIESEWKGWRGDVLVFNNNKTYNVNIVSMLIVLQRFKYSKDFEWDNGTHANTIIVNNVTKEEIKKTISELVKTDFFANLGGKYDKNIDNSNDNIEIIYKNDTKENEKKSFEIGYRDDVIVKANHRNYNLHLITLNKLLQEFYISNCQNGYYLTKPNMIIVEDLTKENIQKAIFASNHSCFFRDSGYLDDKDDWGIFEYMHKKK